MNDTLPLSEAVDVHEEDEEEEEEKHIGAGGFDVINNFTTPSSSDIISHPESKFIENLNVFCELQRGCIWVFYISRACPVWICFWFDPAAG